MLGLVLQARDDKVAEAADLLHRAWGLRYELTGVQGCAEDSDEIYSNLMFYWSR